MILSGDTVVAKWENHTLEALDEHLLPLYLKCDANAEYWLETRAIDSHRPNSRLLKKALRLTEGVQTNPMCAVFKLFFSIFDGVIAGLSR